MLYLIQWYLGEVSFEILFKKARPPQMKLNQITVAIILLQFLEVIIFCE